MGELRLQVALVAVLAVSCGQVTRDSALNPEGELGIGPDFVEGERLKIPHYSTDDGFEQVDYGIYDSARDEKCTFVRTSDTRERCMPSAALEANFFQQYADAACSEPLLEWPIGAPPPPSLSLSDGDPCYPSYSFYESGPEFTGDEDFALVEGVCLPSSPNYRTASYRLGPPLELDAFVAADVEVMPSRGRIAEIHRHAEDGLVQRIGLFDTEFGAECYPELSEDGATRCLPRVRYSWLNLFGAADCQQALVQEQACSADFAPLLNEAVEGECSSSSVRYREIGPTFLGERTFAMSDSQCLEHVAESGPFFEAGAIVAPERFVELTFDRSGTTRLRQPHYIDGQGARLARTTPFIYDSELDVDCAFGSEVGGVFSCGPTLASGRFTDPGCTQPVVLLGREAGPCGPALARYVLMGDTLHHRGSKLPPPREVFVESSGVCEKLSGYGLFEAYDFYAVDAEVEAGLALAVHTAY